MDIHSNTTGIAATFCAQRVSPANLFDALQERIQLGQDYHEFVRKAIEAQLLVLDDLDKLKPSEFREETLYKLLNGRCNAELPLAISSNNPPNDLERWVGSAGRSRLMQGLIPVPMNGPDYRLEIEVMNKRKRTMPPVEPLLLTIPQVSAMLGLGHSKVYDLIRQEGLPTVKFGTATRIPAEELKQWVKQRIA